MILNNLILIIIYLITNVKSIYFYLDTGSERCFIEDLPNETIVVGHYKGEEYDSDKHIYHVNPQLGIQISVTEVETKENIVNTRGLPEGKFTFTSHNSGEHSICMRTNYTGGWFKTSQVKIHIEINLGESNNYEKTLEKDSINEILNKIKDLNLKLKDLRKEQQFQREREIFFRKISEKTNSRALWWSIIQILVLIYMCTWQLHHLRSFFESKKLR